MATHSQQRERGQLRGIDGGKKDDDQSTSSISPRKIAVGGLITGALAYGALLANGTRNNTDTERAVEPNPQAPLTYNGLEPPRKDGTQGIGASQVLMGHEIHRVSTPKPGEGVHDFVKRTSPEAAQDPHLLNDMSEVVLSQDSNGVLDPRPYAVPSIAQPEVPHDPSHAAIHASGRGAGGQPGK